MPESPSPRLEEQGTTEIYNKAVNCELCLLSEGPGPFPGLLDLWGGGGQLVEYRACLLASHGIASLALDYLTPKITMETGKMVELQYFEVNFISE